MAFMRIGPIRFGGVPFPSGNVGGGVFSHDMTMGLPFFTMKIIRYCLYSNRILFRQ